MNRFYDFAHKVCYPQERHVWDYQGVEDNSHGYRLDRLYERIATAQLLGYETLVKTDGKNLRFIFVEKRPIMPLGLKKFL